MQLPDNLKTALSKSLLVDTMQQLLASKTHVDDGQVTSSVAVDNKAVVEMGSPEASTSALQTFSTQLVTPKLSEAQLLPVDVLTPRDEQAFEVGQKAESVASAHLSESAFRLIDERIGEAVSTTSPFLSESATQVAPVTSLSLAQVQLAGSKFPSMLTELTSPKSDEQEGDIHVTLANTDANTPKFTFARSDA